MDDFSGEVSGAIGQIGSQVKSTIFGEVKKIGRNAAGSIVGKNSHHTSHTSGFGASVSAPTPQKTEVHHHTNRFAGMGPLVDILKIGETAGSQVTGKPLTTREITEMAQKSNYADKQDADEVREKILQVYREYNEKKKKSEKEKEWGFHLMGQSPKKEDADKLQMKSKTNLNLPQISKTRAEVGKNFGVE